MNIVKKMVLNQNEDEVTVSSSDESYDSDRIDSDIEAELYSIVHHQQEAFPLNSDKEKNLNTNCVKNKTKHRKNSAIQSNNFFSDRISDCDLYRNFESPDNTQQSKEGSSSLKRKSDTFIECLDDAQSSTTFFEDNQFPGSDRKKLRQKSSNIRERNSVINIDTSDNDSDILCIEPSDSKHLFQTNLSTQTYTLSSDSEDSMPPFNFQNNQCTPLTNFASNDDSEELWFVNDKDLRRFRRNTGRYHETGFSYCTKCKLKGHTVKFCPISKAARCLICGDKRAHWKCKKAVCFRCFKRGHDIKDCQQKLKSCVNCSMKGHTFKDCPDLWRKYHLTTSNEFISSEKLEQDRPVYCYNCGFQGHFGALCNCKRMDNFSSLTWPSVISYDPPSNSNFLAKNSQQKLSVQERHKLQKREQILLKRKRRKEFRKAKNETIKATINYPRTPKNPSKNSPNLNNSGDNFSSTEARQSRKAMHKQKRLIRLRKMKALKKLNSSNDKSS